MCLFVTLVLCTVFVFIFKLLLCTVFVCLIITLVPCAFFALFDCYVTAMHCVCFV